MGHPDTRLGNPGCAARGGGGGGFGAHAAAVFVATVAGCAGCRLGLGAGLFAGVGWCTHLGQPVLDELWPRQFAAVFRADGGRVRGHGFAHRVCVRAVHLGLFAVFHQHTTHHRGQPHR